MDDAGAVEQHVDAADLVDRRLDRVGRKHVEDARGDAGRAVELVELFGIDVGRDHLGAGIDKGMDRSAADALGGGGDEDDLFGKVGHGDFSSVRCGRKPNLRPSGFRWRRNPTRCPSPGAALGTALPSRIVICSVVSSSSCGMYSTQRALGTAAQSATCSSIRKCGQTAMLKASAMCATLSQGVMPPMRPTSTCTIEQACRSRYSRKCSMRIEAFADRDRDRGVVDQPRVAGDIVGGQRLLEPADVERLIGARAADGLVDVEAPGWRR